MLPAIFGLSGLTLSEDERAFFRDCDPAGYILFGRNVESRTQLRALTDELRALHGRERTFICIDQEGGRVARLKPPHWRAYPSAQALSCQPDAARAVYVNARLIAQELHNVGITMDCATVADVLAPECHKIIGDRAFGDNAAQVMRLARAQADALLDEGILPIVKHIPGHGRATMDSHETLPVVSAPLASLEASDFAVFKALNDLPLAMTAHILYTALDDKRCATFSPIVINYIREVIGFEGLIMSDDLSMKALGGSYAKRTEKSLAAGCDLVLHGNGALFGEAQSRDLMAELREVAAHSLVLEGKALARAKAAASQRRTPKVDDAPALLAEWQQLLAAA